MSVLAGRFIRAVHEGILHGVFDHLPHRATVAHTDPAVIEAWAQWKTPDERERLHAGKSGV